MNKLSDDPLLEKMKTGEIFPTNVAPVLLAQGDSDIIAPRLIAWGFPNFRNKGVIINARAETAREKRLFASSVERRRCVIPSTGFFEWDKNKHKYLFNKPDSSMLYMAGLYNSFDSKNCFVILTTEANASVADIHNRMPVVLSNTNINNWLFDINKADDILFGQRAELIKDYVD
jgi:putative SOS response-associated peptidase YedK